MPKTLFVKRKKLIKSEYNKVHSLSTSLVSSAERTINTYKPRFEKKCFGCDSPDHVWTIKGSKNILCPNKDKADVRDNAEKNFDSFKQRMRERRGEKTSTKKRNFPKNFVTSLLADKDAMQLLRKSFSQDSTGDNTNLCFKIVVLSSNHSSKPQLPITIALSVPHIFVS